MATAYEISSTEELIRWMGDRSYVECGLCKGRNVWHIDFGPTSGHKDSLPTKLCSWCDLEKGRRFSGVNFPWPV